MRIIARSMSEASSRSSVFKATAIASSIASQSACTTWPTSSSSATSRTQCRIPHDPSRSDTVLADFYFRRFRPEFKRAVDAWIGPRLKIVEGVRASVDEIEASGAGWTFAKLTIANGAIREVAASAT